VGIGKLTKRHFIFKSVKTAAVAACVCLILTQALGCTGGKKEVPTVTVSLGENSISLMAGYTHSLSAKVKSAGKSLGTAGSWSTNNAAVASVDATGIVMAVAAGECKVTYSVGTQAKAACDVTVTPSSNWTTVLMYHSLNATGNKLRVPPADFDTQMKWLHDNNYNTLSLDELYNYVTSKKPFPPKTAVITFDDGYVDAYDSGLPIIEKYKLHATVFMISSYIGTKYFLSADQLKQMSDSGCFDIEDHTVTHTDLDTLTYDQQYKELNDSKQAIEKITGKKIEYISYPTGKYNKDTLAAAQALGYKMGFKMEGGSATLQDSPLEFPRSFVDKNLNTLIDAVNGLGY
jgi:peptidoglycan/xylan/chitin deacetylase (PgdA/CDA1 family)